jgi:hypothetical protein
MKVNEIISEVGLKKELIKKGINFFKQQPDKGLAPTSAGARQYKAQLQKNRSDALKDLAKKNQNARIAAQTKIKGLPAKAITGLQLLVGTAALTEYFTEISTLEEEYEKFQKGESSIFDGMDAETATATARSMRQDLLGKLVTVMFINLKGPMVAAKALKWIISMIPVVGTVSKVAGSAVAATSTGSRLISGLTTLSNASAPVIAAFMLSPFGKQFMEHWLVSSITGTVGTATAVILDLGIKGLEAAGVTVPAALKSKIPSDSDAQMGNVPGVAAGTHPSLVVSKDPKNPNIIKIGGVAVTGDDGYLKPGIDPYIQDVKSRAAALDAPDPTASLKRRP